MAEQDTNAVAAKLEELKKMASEQASQISWKDVIIGTAKVAAVGGLGFLAGFLVFGDTDNSNIVSNAARKALTKGA